MLGAVGQVAVLHGWTGSARPLDAVNTKTFQVNNPFWGARTKSVMVNWIPDRVDRRTVEAMRIALMIDPQGDPEIIRVHERTKATLAEWGPIVLAAEPPGDYCESCSSCAEIFVQWKMNLASHHARYAERYEELLYNSLWHPCPRCARTLLMLPTWTYAKSADGVYVNLYIGGTTRLENVAGTDVEIVQETYYPWDGRVFLTINPATTRRFTVRVRMPNVAATGLSSLTLNGGTIKPAIKRGYAVISRDWKAGDRVEMELPMKVQRGKVGLRYGPLIYKIEGMDQGIAKPLSPDSPLTTEWRGDLLGGVMAIRGQFADGSPMMAIPDYAGRV